MNTPVRLATFGLGLVVAFAAGMGIGAVVGPVDAGDPVVETPAQHGTHEEGPR